MKKPLLIGWMVIGAILLLIALSKLAGISWTHSAFPPIHFFFTNVNGLKTHDPVLIHGYPVGVVSAIQLQDSGCLVTVTLNQDVSIFTDASAEIQIKELMTGKQLVLYPGKSGKKFYGVIYGKSTFDWASGLSKMGEMLNESQMPELMKNIHRLSENLVSLTDSFSQIQLSPMFVELRLTLAHIRFLTEDFQKQNLITETKQTLQSVRQLSEDVRPKLNHTFTLVDSSLQLLPNTLQQVQAELLQADMLMKTLQKQLLSLETPGTFMNSLFHDVTLAAQIDSTLHNLNRTLDHIRTKKVHVNLSLTPKNKVYSE